MRRALGSILCLLILGACTPVMDPARWDPTMYCKTIGPDEWCSHHGHG